MENTQCSIAQYDTIFEVEITLENGRQYIVRVEDGSEIVRVESRNARTLQLKAFDHMVSIKEATD